MSQPDYRTRVETAIRTASTPACTLTKAWLGLLTDLGERSRNGDEASGKLLRTMIGSAADLQLNERAIRIVVERAIREQRDGTGGAA